VSPYLTDTKPVETGGSYRLGLLPSAFGSHSAQPRAVWNNDGVNEPPQVEEQAPRQGDDTDASLTPTPAAEAFLEPAVSTLATNLLQSC
jgi:hypothetical protein